MALYMFRLGNEGTWVGGGCLGWGPVRRLGDDFAVLLLKAELGQVSPRLVGVACWWHTPLDPAGGQRHTLCCCWRAPDARRTGGLKQVHLQEAVERELPEISSTDRPMRPRTLQ